MQIEGSYTFEASRDVVWKAFLDPDVLAKTLPGCEKLERVGENDYKGTLKVKVGPVQSQFRGTVNLLDLNPPESYRMKIDGRGPAGFMKGEGNIKLEDRGETTVLHYEGTAQVGGKIMSVGQRLIDSTSKSLTRQALENMHQQIKAGQNADQLSESHAQATVRPGPFSSSAAEFEAPSQTQFALDVARDVIEDLIPPERRSTIIAAALGVMALFILAEWWAGRIARRVVNILEKRR